VITSEKIEMTAPVISDAKSFSFAMPLKYKFEEAPEPSDSRIGIQKIPGRRFAVIRFKGELFLMRYNPPYTLCFMRRNEIGIEIAQSLN
jgi:hypothetical protein